MARTRLATGTEILTPVVSTEELTTLSHSAVHVKSINRSIEPGARGVALW